MCQGAQGHWKTLTFLGHVEQFLIPTLKPGDIVILDNLGNHRGEAVRKVIRAAGARLLSCRHTAPTSTPIEQVFAKIKTNAAATSETRDMRRTNRKRLSPEGGVRSRPNGKEACVPPPRGRCQAVFLVDAV